MNFASNLQKLRKDKNMSQEALAEKLDVTRQSVSKWESGVTYPEMDKLISICKIFNVDMDTLVNGDVSLKNETLIAPNIDYYMVENSTTGYLYMQTFSNTLAQQVENALNELESQGMTSLVIDLRNNTGGYLTSATDVASIFLEKGQRIFGLNYQNEITYYQDETKDHKEYEIVVLINGNTASASEILASALKESYGATIVGETSFGKGKVQQTMELDDGSMVKYTSAYWLTPNGTCIDEIGITPDHYITNEETTDETGNAMMIDNQLDRAIEILQNNK